MSANAVSLFREMLRVNEIAGTPSPIEASGRSMPACEIRRRRIFAPLAMEQSGEVCTG
jgi:hypothetical protein